MKPNECQTDKTVFERSPIIGQKEGLYGWVNTCEKDEHEVSIINLTKQLDKSHQALTHEKD